MNKQVVKRELHYAYMELQYMDVPLGAMLREELRQGIFKKISYSKAVLP